MILPLGEGDKGVMSDSLPLREDNQTDEHYMEGGFHEHGARAWLPDAFADTLSNGTGLTTGKIGPSACYGYSCVLHTLSLCPLPLVTRREKTGFQSSDPKCLNKNLFILMFGVCNMIKPGDFCFPTELYMCVSYSL